MFWVIVGIETMIKHYLSVWFLTVHNSASRY